MSRNSPVRSDKTKRGVVCWRSIAIMTNVDYCVVGAGFAGLTAALRLKQAGESVALLEARDRVGGRTFTEVRDDGLWIGRGGGRAGPGPDQGADERVRCAELQAVHRRQSDDGGRRQAAPLLRHHPALDESVG